MTMTISELIREVRRQVQEVEGVYLSYAEIVRRAAVKGFELKRERLSQIFNADSDAKNRPTMFLAPETCQALAVALDTDHYPVDFFTVLHAWTATLRYPTVLRSTNPGEATVIYREPRTPEQLEALRLAVEAAAYKAHNSRD
jgi:hypothetical protein